MHASPSLFFDILGEEDELKRDEKIKRASLDIKSNLTTNSNSGPVPATAATANAAAPAAAAQSASSPASAKLWALQQHLLATAAPIKGDSASDYSHQPPAAAPAGDANAPAAEQTGTNTAHPQQEQQHQQPVEQPNTVQQADVSQQQQQQQQQALAAVPSQFTLTPQEVLQELLGDLFIHENRLQMGELLGQGGFADVHAAELTDPLLGFSQRVAVKRLRPDVLASPADLREFLTEANLLRKLAHRNIVQLRGVGASDLSDLVHMRESMFVVQEFMAGGDLKALVMAAMGSPFAPPYSKAQALAWALQAAEALHYLHAVCRPMIIHRDLKLDNLLLSSSNPGEATAKLADFGLHKRVRKLVSSGALVPWNQDTTYRGADYEPSFYGGNLYLTKTAFSAAGSSKDEGSAHGSLGGSLHGAGGAHSATSIQQVPSVGPFGDVQQQQQQQQQLMSAVRAKSQGLLGKQDFVTQVLSAGGELLGGPSAAGMMQHSQEVSRTFAAVQALEGSVRAGSAFYATAPTAAAAAPELPEIVPAPSSTKAADVTAAVAPQRPKQQRQQQQQSELCPQLVQQLQAGLAATKDSQKFIDATQKVGSLMYMAPEVLTGRQYNEKVDVFAFGVILYELLSGVVVAGRVALAGEHDELLDYARKVANGHREALPTYWPAPVKDLVAACWAQDPAARPSFQEVLRRLYKMQQAGVAAVMEKARPSSGYNPVTDCGCCIM
ncbi:hypothetical protein OEZ86_011904 [Tetradesmus obliquus]|nr:hypothetical protein OEZ86_011904 [Tetradesmus obliquus]